MGETYFDLAWDHQVPQSRGGETVLDNLVLACMPCNNDKSTLTVEVYRDVVKSRLLRQTKFLQRFARGTPYEARLRGMDWKDFKFYGERNG